MGRHRRTTYVAAALAAATLAATPLVGDATIPRASVRPVYGSPPRAMVVDGVVVALVDEARVYSVRLTGPATLVVAAGYRREGKPARCEAHTEVRVLEQSATYVRLGAYRYSAPLLDNRIVCALVGRPPAEATVSLDAPLGGRAVYANGSAATVPVGDPAKVLRATRVPDGFAARGETEFFATNALWRTEHAGPARGEELTVSQGPWQLLAPPERGVRVLARPVVNGHEATVYAGPTATCVAWRDGESAGIAVCHSGSKKRLGMQALRDVADGLRT